MVPTYLRWAKLRANGPTRNSAMSTGKLGVRRAPTLETRPGFSSTSSWSGLGEFLRSQSLDPANSSLQSLNDRPFGYVGGDLATKCPLEERGEQARRFWECQ
jgi:hypothetical protein